MLDDVKIEVRDKPIFSWIVIVTDSSFDNLYIIVWPNLLYLFYEKQQKESPLLDYRYCLFNVIF